MGAEYILRPMNWTHESIACTQINIFPMDGSTVLVNQQTGVLVIRLWSHDVQQQRIVQRNSHMKKVISILATVPRSWKMVSNRISSSKSECSESCSSWLVQMWQQRSLSYFLPGSSSPISSMYLTLGVCCDVPNLHLPPLPLRLPCQVLLLDWHCPSRLFCQ
jgi:hypothetical protein